MAAVGENRWPPAGRNRWPLTHWRGRLAEWLASVAAHQSPGAHRVVGPVSDVPWAAQYRDAVEHDDPSWLLSVGQEMLDWLDADGWASGWLRGSGARVLEVAVESDDAEVARLLLDLPWEVLADGHDFLAADPAQPYVVFRGLGRDRDDEPAQPFYRDLAVLFMAASPAGQGVLAFEAEEAAVLAATERLPVQIAVEESGCAEFLEARLAHEGPFEVVHVSCHGGIRDDVPVLALETPAGELELARDSRRRRRRARREQGAARVPLGVPHGGVRGRVRRAVCPRAREVGGAKRPGVGRAGV